MNAIFTINLVALALLSYSLFRFIKYIFSNLSKLEKILIISWTMMFYGVGLYFFGSDDFYSGARGFDIFLLIQILTTVTAASLAILVIDKKNLLSTPATNFFLLYALFGAISAIYSPLPAHSMFRSIQYCTTILLGALLAKEMARSYMPERVMLINYIFVATFIFGTIIGALFDPGGAFREFGGIFGKILYGYFPFMNANTFGWLSAVLFTGAAFNAISQAQKPYRGLWITLAAGAMTTLVLAQSRTALISIGIVSPLFFYAMARQNSLKLGLTLGIIFTLFYITMYIGGIEIITDLLLRGQKTSVFETFEGRLEFVEGVGASLIWERPVLGGGYDAAARTAVGTHFHNSHAQILVNSGAIGYALWSLGFLSYLYYTQRWCLIGRRMGKVKKLEITSINILLLVRTLTGSILVIHDWPLMIMLGIFIYCFALQKQKTERLVYFAHPNL
jgi:hypothetical protein